MSGIPPVRRDCNSAIYLNIRGLYLLSNRTKVQYLHDRAKTSNCSMILITESWLTPDILDAEVSIQGYTLYRADREDRTHGGCAAWIRNDLTTQLVLSQSNSYVETLILNIKTFDTMIILQYRPPDCPYEKFDEALKTCQNVIDETMNEDSKIRNIIDFGDYNFPCISWPSRRVYVLDQEARKNKACMKKQAELYLKFQDENFLSNHIETPTRGKAILDLISSNNHMIIQFYKITINKKLSDHNTIEVSFNFSYNQETKIEKIKNPYSTRVFEFKTKEADEEQWNRFEHLLDQFDEEMLNDKKAEEQLDIIYNVIEEAVKLSIPRKKEFEEEDKSEDNIAKSTKNFIPKKVRQLMKKKQNLSEKIMKYKNWNKNYKIQIELEQVEEELDGHYKERRQDEERKAIKKLYHDPSYFYKYQKKFSKTNGQLNGFLDKRGNVTKEPYEMSEMLRAQYQSVASEPKKESVVEDGNYFFFFTSPSPASYHFPSSPSTTNQEVIFPQDGECNDCEQGRVHLCQEDANLEQPYEGAGAASAQELRDLLAHHIERIEDERAASSSPGDQEDGHPTHPGARLQEETTREWMACDWADLSEAIDSIPAGASPGPDGIPAILLKKAKKPLSRMLCKLMKKTLETGEIPPRLKRSLIIPIHKGGSQGDPVNFRPISLTSHIMKTIERVIRRNIVIFLEAGNKLDPKQHGSRAQRSTLSQLLQHQDEILKALESGENIDCVYLDFAKAYDKVDHGILLHKLKALGISGHIGRWLMNFLTGRLQEVLVKGRKSQVFILVSGVPQGSVLGPILFLIFIGDISAGVVATILVYVDDSKVIKKVNTEEEVEELQEDLNQIYRWEKTNNMMFNGGKFLVVRYGANTELKQNTLYFTGEMQDVIKSTSVRT